MSRLLRSSLFLVLAAPRAQATEFSPAPSDGQPAPALVLERYAGIVEGRHPGEFWQLVCTLPCASNVADGGTYRLRAPDLSLPPLRLAAPVSEQVWVSAPHRRSYRRVALGGALLGVGVAGAVSSAAYLAYTNNPHTQTVDGALFIASMPAVLIGLACILEGPTDIGGVRLGE